MAEYTNFDLKKFIAENKQANVVKENTQGFDALMDAVNDYIDPSHPDHERLAQEVEKALDNGEIDTLEFSHAPGAASRAVEFIAKELGIDSQFSEETVSEESGLASAAVQEFLAADSNGVTIAEFVKAMIDGAAASLGDEAEYYDLDDASQSILKAVGRGDLIGEETVSELDGTGAVDAATALIGALGLGGGAIALNKLMDSLEAGKLGEKGKAVAKFLRDAGGTFSGQGAPMKEETTVELTKEEAFKKEIKDLLDS